MGRPSFEWASDGGNRHFCDGTVRYRADVSPARLKQFFTRDSGRFKVTKQLREAVIVSRHDLLTDPPFAHLDLVSCRNLLIYLRPEAQRRVVALFHFAVRDGGLLLLGSAESVTSAPGLLTDAFVFAAKEARDLGLARPGDNVIISAGIPIGEAGTTNLLKVERVTG